MAAGGACATGSDAADCRPNGHRQRIGGADACIEISARESGSRVGGRSQRPDRLGLERGPPKKIRAQPRLSTAPWVTDRARGRGNGRPAASKTRQAQVRSSCAVSDHLHAGRMAHLPSIIGTSPKILARRAPMAGVLRVRASSVGNRTEVWVRS